MHITTKLLSTLSVGLLSALFILHSNLNLDAQSTPLAPDVAALEARLMETPILHQLDTPEVRAIYEAGQTLGNRADVFALFGDSNTTNGDFMYPFGLNPMPCDFGEYEGLEETAMSFAAVAVEGARNSFVRDHVTADRGMTSASIFDPFWATDPLCEPGETPLLCETRLTQPATAIILLGQININYGGASVEVYRETMTQMVEELVGQGIVPVLTTLVYLPERTEYATSLLFNEILLNLADEYQIPVINMWRAVREYDLLTYGIGPDRSHLSAAVGHYCDFTGSETRYGGTLRNLLSLQVLDTLRREVFTEA